MSISFEYINIPHLNVIDFNYKPVFEYFLNSIIDFKNSHITIIRPIRTSLFFSFIYIFNIFIQLISTVNLEIIQKQNFSKIILLFEFKYNSVIHKKYIFQT